MARYSVSAVPRPASVDEPESLQFPGCRPVRISRNAIADYEDRIEYRRPIGVPGSAVGRLQVGIEPGVGGSFAAWRDSRVVGKRRQSAAGGLRDGIAGHSGPRAQWVGGN